MPDAWMNDPFPGDTATIGASAGAQAAHDDMALLIPKLAAATGMPPLATAKFIDFDEQEPATDNACEEEIIRDAKERLAAAAEAEANDGDDEGDEPAPPVLTTAQRLEAAKTTLATVQSTPELGDNKLVLKSMRSVVANLEAAIIKEKKQATLPQMFKGASSRKSESL